jgi:prepilin-type N-terminal cleavage/methylation domain-containing protein
MTTKQNKGFTLLEILLVIAAIGILAAIVLVAINPNRQIAQARNTVRQADINTIQKAVEQYLIEKGSYPNGITNTYREICNTGSNNNTQGTVSNECIDLRELVPDYIASIPVNPSTSTHSGYYAWINDINNKVAVLAGKGENGKVIGINHLKENIVTDGLVLHLDAGNLASYPGTGNTWFDLSGNGNNGTLFPSIGGPTYNSANGGSFSFDGVNDFVNSNFGPKLGPGDEFSSTIWFQTIVSQTGRLIEARDSSKIGNPLIALLLGNNRIDFLARGQNGSRRDIIASGINYTDGEWRMVTVNITETSNTQLFVNGILVGSNNSGIDSRIDLSGTPLAIGARNLEGNIDAFLTGNISQVSIYNRALTSEEVQQNFNASRGRFGL